MSGTLERVLEEHVGVSMFESFLITLGSGVAVLLCCILFLVINKKFCLLPSWKGVSDSEKKKPKKKPRKKKEEWESDESLPPQLPPKSLEISFGGQTGDVVKKGDG